MTDMTTARPVAHLVGSTPLADAEAVLRAAASALGASLTRIPDGCGGIIAFFERLQGEGVIGADTKFQISLPTPLVPGYNHVSPL